MPIETVNTSLGEYLTALSSDKFSFVMSRRTDPRVWTQSLEGLDEAYVEERDNGGRSKHYNELMEIKSNFRQDFLSILSALAQRIRTDSQIYLSIGTGNTGLDPNEYVQRRLFLTQAMLFMQGIGMNVKTLDQGQLHNVGFARYEGEIEKALITGTFSGKALGRLGISLDEEKSVKKEKGRSRKRH